APERGGVRVMRYMPRECAVLVRTCRGVGEPRTTKSEAELMRNIARLAYFCGATVGASLVAASWASIAAAQVGGTELGNEGFALNRFEPAERGSEWFALDSVNESGHVRPAFGLTLDYARKPLVLVNANDEEVRGVVDNQWYAHLGGSIVLLDKLRLGL